MMTFNRVDTGCPCKGCTDRVPDPKCHGTCEKYKAWREELDKRNEAERTYHKSQDTMSDAKKRALWKSKRYQRQLTYPKKINTR